MLTINIDPHGQPFQDFFEMRKSAVSKPLDLRKLPYRQLPLAAVAPAGNFQIPLDEVRKEKEFRRARFINLPEEEFQTCRRYLQMEDMFTDLLTQRALENTPKWSELSKATQAWAKLDCLFNHLDNPAPRLANLDDLLAESATTGRIPLEVASNFRTRVRDLTCKLASTPIEKFRDRIGSLQNEVWEYMDEEEQVMMTPRLMQGYSCTADCFRVFTGVRV